MSDTALRDLRRKLLEDGYGDVVRWVERLGVSPFCRHETLDAPLTYEWGDFQSSGGRIRVGCHVPASMGLRNTFEWCGVTLVTSAKLTRVTIFNAGSDRTVLDTYCPEILRGAGREPALGFRPIVLPSATTVSLEIQADEPSRGTVFLHGRRTGEW